MSLISAGSLMISTIHVSGPSIQRDDPKILFQSGYFNGVHPGEQYHAYAVSSDGERFLIPQIDNPITVFNGRGGTLGINAGIVLAAIAAERNSGTASGSNSDAPINVVLNWTAGLKEK
jgi:hypothetical protein